MLQTCAMGFGGIALRAMASENRSASVDPLAPKPCHFSPRAKNVIFLYMDGGPSQVDTFDYKPALEKYNGQDPRKVIGKLAPTQFDSIGKVLKSPWAFKQRGQSGAWVSDLFPYLAQEDVIDEISMVKSMTSNFSEHTSANYFLHTGNGFQGRPSMGAWLGYGLGTENRNLPGFVVLNGGLIPPGGLDCFGSGFLPATYQGSVFLPQAEPVANINRREATEELQKSKLSLLRGMDEQAYADLGGDPQVEAAIRNYETAFLMQSAVPELMDLSKEPESTFELYGKEAREAGTFAACCLNARRLAERGVRNIQIFHRGWDAHGNLPAEHESQCKDIDQGSAALIKDLKQRGMLEDTLVVWGGEFGRTVYCQGGLSAENYGRDHHPRCFTVWMAGGGIRPGITYGRTDDYGYNIADADGNPLNPQPSKDRWTPGAMHIHDLNATILHLLGMDHKRLTYRYQGRDFRLTDVHGHVMHDLLA